ncbi:hypothetical protein OJAV_G00124770 [Oryzias javanicus]|uniref:Fibronectin type-III domain-containing protein n=1 Tax=Oryzias javanicus TaxID=123683 RepID=A0A3S2MFJ8_ORYJA|nr:hypothetical protein OJAV_G00124770 [Oryzias javanicus]
MTENFHRKSGDVLPVDQRCPSPRQVMDTQKEALRRIIGTLANKREELQHFLDSIDGSLSGLQDESCKAMMELEAELDQLRSSLEERGAELREMIKGEEQRKKAELKRQRSEGACALQSCDDLLAFSNQTLTVSDEDDFLTAARLIKERVTMAPAFRLTTRPCVSESMSQFAVDFSAEREGLHKLHFLPGQSHRHPGRSPFPVEVFGFWRSVPRAPEIDVSGCSVQDNAVRVTWRPAAEADADGCRPIQRYELEYRKTGRRSVLVGGACWERICEIGETQVTISGLKFDSPFVVVRVRARNKAAAGEFSEPVALETRAFSFGFDEATAHADLRVHGDTVTWEPQGVRGHDPRLRSKEKSRGAWPFD